MNSYEIQEGICRMAEGRVLAEPSVERQLIEARDAWETAVVKLAALRKTQRDLSDALIEANEAVMDVEHGIPELEAAYRGLLLKVHG